jgi:peptidyl-prolyl cis-trans isomerase SurA
LAGALSSGPAFAQDERVLDEIVALVDNSILLRSDVDGLLFNAVQQGQVEYNNDTWLEALDQLIDQKVMAAHARRDTNITVTDDELTQALDQRIQQMSAQVGGEDRLEEIYGKSVIQIKAELRTEFRDQLLADRLQRGKMETVRTTPSQVRSWYAAIPPDSLPEIPEAVQVSHIVRHPTITDEARSDALDILSTIRDSILVGGASFEEMAALFSDDPGSANQGGRYSSSSLDDFVPEFAAVASRMPVGEISQIFETEFGLHILRVNERRGDVVDLNQILIEFDRGKFDPEPAISYLEGLRDTLLTGAQDFGRIARLHSQDEASASNGGRVLDPRTGRQNLFLESLGPDWRETLFELDVGDISKPDPVQLLDGRRAYHIVWLRERIPEHRLDLDTDYAMVEEFALRDLQARVLRGWLDGLRESVYIDIRVDTAQAATSPSGS